MNTPTPTSSPVPPEAGGVAGGRRLPPPPLRGYGGLAEAPKARRREAPRPEDI
jgi:hypothetical protein